MPSLRKARWRVPSKPTRKLQLGKQMDWLVGYGLWGGLCHINSTCKYNRRVWHDLTWLIYNIMSWFRVTILGKYLVFLHCGEDVIRQKSSHDHHYCWIQGWSWIRTIQRGPKKRVVDDDLLCFVCCHYWDKSDSSAGTCSALLLHVIKAEMQTRLSALRSQATTKRKAKPGRFSES